MGMNNHIAVQLHWLTKKTNLQKGVTWGVPWKEGDLQRTENLILLDDRGNQVAVQSWPTAYWADGSIKWTAHAAAMTKGVTDFSYILIKGESSLENSALSVKETEGYIEVHTGSMVCRLHRKGSSLIQEIHHGGRRLCSDGKLVGIREARLTIDGAKSFKEEPFHSIVDSAEVEQQGPVRVVVKFTGRHQMESDGRKWLPFTLRLYFYANHDGIKAVHTFLYDGDPHHDFIKGLGISLKVPMKGELYNRHIRLAGDAGFFRESPKGLETFRTTGKYKDLYQEQTEGRKIHFDPEQDAKFVEMVDDLAVWDSFKLVQYTADSYSISKQTKEECCWVKAAAGNRAGGLMYVGSDHGGLALGVRNFWQKAPSSLEAKHLSHDEADLTAWFWSPDVQAMDLRHYDTVTHLKSAYEGADEMRSTPYGIGNTRELNLWCLEATPNLQSLNEMLEEKEDPALLVCNPEYYYDSGAMGVWSLPNRSTSLKETLENGLDNLFEFYQNEIEQRRWYGFWDYGDIMHSYDPVRHTWRYDIGGCAWQNTELVPNLWLWYMFLRSGRKDVFRMAEAMARHTSEVDVYHMGEYAGLGSRHNVLHWGCGCKEARIGMSGLHKIYYYLTADERIGDIMDEAKDSDYTTVHIDPMRAYFPKDEFPTHARSGPDWAAFSSNWLTRWERHEDTFYRDKILTGIKSLKSMPFRLLTGPTFGYDPATGDLHYMGDENYGHHMIIGFGAPQVWMDLAAMIKDPEWEEMLAEFGEFYNLPVEEKMRRTSGAIKGKDWNIPMLSTTMMAIAAAKNNDKALAEQAWSYLLRDQAHWQINLPVETIDVQPLEYIREIKELQGISTNTASQWSLNVMICLELIGHWLPEKISNS
jgi:hypothetical protein